MTDVLGIFVKHPIAGRVKTRLAADIGAEAACALYAAFVDDIVDRFRFTANKRLLCYAPASPAGRAWCRGIAGGQYELWPQPETSLGGRLESFFAEQFAAGMRRVVVIGSDSPTLPRTVVEQAFQLLGDADCVLGPSTDGGYYLAALKDHLLPMFDDIEWSTPRVFDQTVARLKASGASWTLLPSWFDVDTADDLAELRRHLRHEPCRGERPSAPQTARVLAQLDE